MQIEALFRGLPRPHPRHEYRGLLGIDTGDGYRERTAAIGLPGRLRMAPAVPAVHGVSRVAPRRKGWA